MGRCRGWVRGVQCWPGEGNSLKGAAYREVASAPPPLPRLCPPPPRSGLCPSLPGVALVGHAPACGCRPRSGEAGVDFSLPPRPRAPRRVPRLPPPTTASRSRGPRPRPALQLLQGAVPRLPAAWLEVGDHPRTLSSSGSCPYGNLPLGEPPPNLGHAPRLEPGLRESSGPEPRP